MPRTPATYQGHKEQIVTTALQPTAPDGRVSNADAFSPAAPPDKRRRLGGLLAVHDPAWPVVALLAGWPVWWALGVGDYAPVVVAIPMAWRLYKWQASGRRRVRLPPGFGLGLLFLLVMLAGVVAVGQVAPDTMPGPSGTKVISWGMRAVSYLGATVVLLYAGNLTRRELPLRRFAWLLGLVGIYAVIGGFAALGDPSFRFTSPLAFLVPASLQAASQGQLTAQLHPGFTEIEAFLGHGRVAAPFLYANTWGNNIAITLPWLLVAWRSFGSRWERKAVWVVLALAVLPIVDSYDRGLWLAIAFSLFYLAVRFAAQGKVALLAGFCIGLLVLTLVVLLSPLSSLISTRLANGQSDTARSSLSLLSVEDALGSPLIGYGDTRREFGSQKSIAIGRTANCSACGQRSVGSNGQLWLLLITTGFTGTVLYMGFFGYGVWRYRRDRTPYGITGVLILLLSFVFSIAYDAVGGTLAFTMLAYAILWRNDRESQHADDPPAIANGRAAQLEGDPGGVTAEVLS
jgi:hypothetical protein